MIRSMTGFGQAELKSPQGSIRVELKSTNHKFLEISSRLPGHLAEYEEQLRKQASQKVSRGKIFMFVSCPDPSVFSSRLVLNESLAKEVFHKTRSVQKILNLKNVSEDAMLREVLRYPDVLTKDSSHDRGLVAVKRVSQALELSLANLDRSRGAEGKALLKDLQGRVREIRNSLNSIARRLPALAKEYKKNLAQRSKTLLKNGQVDHDRLTQEVAQYLKSSDISEEVTRLRSHLQGMDKALAEKGELGRKIDFIAQEMTRETNTIGAKSSDVSIANNVIQLKSSIEKIREQAQNVE
jgi:uncharacterized protein (TIGR00255 family)